MAMVQTFVSLLFNYLYLYLFNHTETFVLNFDYCRRQRDFKILLPLNADARAHKKRTIYKWIVEE